MVNNICDVYIYITLYHKYLICQSFGKKTTNSLLERVKLNRFNKKTLLPWKQESLNFLEELAGEETFIRCVFQVG